MRLGAIATIAAANAFVAARCLPEHNRRFRVALTALVDAHTPVPRHWRLNEIVVLEEERVLRRDWVIQFEHRALQLIPTAAARRRVGPGQRVLVRTTPEGPLQLVAVDPSTAREYPLPWTELTGAASPAPATAPATAGALARGGGVASRRSGRPRHTPQAKTC